MFGKTSIVTLAALMVAATLLFAASTAQAHPCNGIERGEHRVDGGATTSFDVCFNANETARVVVLGDGDTDLDLYVYGPNGELVGTDVDLSDYCEVTWTARRGGTYHIEVRNYGNVYNDFIIRVD